MTEHTNIQYNDYITHITEETSIDTDEGDIFLDINIEKNSLLEHSFHTSDEIYKTYEAKETDDTLKQLHDKSNIIKRETQKYKGCFNKVCAIL